MRFLLVSLIFLSGRSMATVHLSSRGYLQDANRVLLTLGLQELRDRAPQTFVQMDLQVPLFHTLALGLQAMVPTERKDLHYYWGGALHWYGRAPNGGLWLSAGAGQYAYRGLPGRTAARAAVGWRWRPEDHNGSFGFSLGPEVLWTGGRSDWGGVFRFDVGVDFRPGQVFQ